MSFDNPELGLCPLPCREEYHAQIGRSVTDCRVVRRRKGGLFLLQCVRQFLALRDIWCGAIECRLWGKNETRNAVQYSAASMMVMTRSVTVGSAGFGECTVMVRSK